VLRGRGTKGEDWDDDPARKEKVKKEGGGPPDQLETRRRAPRGDATKRQKKRKEAPSINLVKRRSIEGGDNLEKQRLKIGNGGEPSFAIKELTNQVSDPDKSKGGNVKSTN